MRNSTTSLPSGDAIRRAAASPTADARQAAAPSSDIATAARTSTETAGATRAAACLRLTQPNRRGNTHGPPRVYSMASLLRATRRACHAATSPHRHGEAACHLCCAPQPNEGDLIPRAALSGDSSVPGSKMPAAPLPSGAAGPLAVSHDDQGGGSTSRITTTTSHHLRRRRSTSSPPRASSASEAGSGIV